MSNKIIKYSDKFNVKTIESQIPLDGSTSNYNNEYSPLSFKEWLIKRTGIKPGREYYEYNRYIRSWYSELYDKKEVQVNALKTDYINLLKELSILFKDDDNLKFINDVNYEDNLDLEYAIPYYTKKLKEIAYYIVKKRDSLKNAKLKYNMAGSNQSIEKLFYQYLLQAFTAKNTLVEVPEFSAISLLPNLSATNIKFGISIEEIYDNSSYFDKDPLNTATYFCENKQNQINQANLNYFDSLNFGSSSVNWIYESGYMPLCANNPLLWTLDGLLNEYNVTETSQLPFSALDLSDIENSVPNDYTMFDLNKKYLGNNFYILTGGYYILDETTNTINLIKGNNWFYWPSGEFYTDNYKVPPYSPISLSSSNLVNNGANASEDYRSADKIFVQTESEVKGAWLKYSVITTQNSTMNCVIAGDSSLTFKFPYCNFGYVGDGNSWSGRGINNLNAEYYFLDDDLKRKTDLLYWENTDARTISSIEINDTTLSNISGINASQYYVNADKIIKRTATGAYGIYDANANNGDDLQSAVYNDGFEYAWLYKPEKTDLPIKVGKNNYLWPLQRLDSTTNSTIKVSSDFTTPVALSSLDVKDFTGSRAGYGLSDSDIIYKLSSKGGFPIEAAYLKGQLIRNSLPSNIKVIDSTYTTYTSAITGIMQIGLNHKCKPNAPETFIWQDPDTEISTLNLTYKPHQDDCPFSLYSKHPSIYNQKDGEEFSFQYPWTECNCKSVVYSPIGHTGNKFTDFGGMADIIVLDNQYPNNFNLNDWRDSNGNNFEKSSDFAWYKIEKPENLQNNKYGLDVDVGMGVGRWVTGSGQPFTFKQGKQYKYIRNSMGRSVAEVDSALVPYFIISTPYTNAYKPTWYKAEYNSTLQSWVEKDQATDMVLNAGDYIVYDHFESDFYCLRFDGTYKEYNVITYPQQKLNTNNNPWVNFNVATVSTPIIIKWPEVKTDNSFKPSLLNSELSSITWLVSSNSPTLSSFYVNYSPENSLTVICDSPTTFIIRATGYSDIGISKVNESIIGSISILDPQMVTTPVVTGAYDIRTIYADTINYIWNSPLTSCKAFWGQGLDDSSYTTKFKGVREWGYGLRLADDYTFIHQPPTSRLSLNAEDVITYQNKGSTITWKQPLIFNTFIEDKKWCKLNYIANKQSPLSSYLNNIDTELVVYPTDEYSDITLKSYDYVNYYSNNDFTWTEVLTNTTNGIPPFGGKYVPYVSSIAIEPLVPHANLTNRHYPSIAVYPNVNGFFTEKESGGYFLPYIMGTNVYLGKNYTNIINPELSANTPNSTENLFRNPSIWVSNDVGLTNTRQSGPIINDSYNASWMKGSYTEGYKAGEIKNAIDYKEFIPYQTKEETLKQDVNNIVKKDFDLDPWYGEFDDVWKDETSWPSNFRNEHRIVDWYTNNNFFIKQIDNTIFNKTITISEPIICNGDSKFIFQKLFTNTECTGCGTTVSAISTQIFTSIAGLSADGSIILNINNTYLNNNHISVYTSPNISIKSVDPKALIYAEQAYNESTKSSGYLKIKVNNSYYYILVNIGRRTRECVTNLQGTLYTSGSFTTHGYITVKLNDSKKVYLRLYKRL